MKQSWRVSYVASPGKLIIIEHPSKQLVIYGKHYSKKSALHLITRWVKLKAHDFLVAQLKKINRRVKAKYKKIIVRTQELQWGSYSSAKTISMNYKLIFLPPTLVRHLIIHELCHTIHLHHSETFWQEVARYDKNWKRNKIALNEADVYIPKWAIY